MKTRLTPLLIIVILGFAVLAYQEYQEVKRLKSVTNKTDVKFLHGDTLRDTIPIKEPIVIYRDTGSIRYLDAIRKDSSRIDSAKLLADYAMLRTYRNELFNNDSLGSLVLSSTVQYNRLSNLSYEFVPIHKVITKELVRIGEQDPKVIPFIGVGITTNSQGLINGGVFLKNNIGFQGIYQYNLDTHKNSIGLGVMIKFN